MIDIKLKHLLLGVAACSISMQAEIVLPGIYTDNMVLQRNSTVTVPGTAAPGAQVTMRADWLAAPVSGKADRNGKFSLELETPDYGGPTRLY